MKENNNIQKILIIVLSVLVVALIGLTILFFSERAENEKNMKEIQHEKELLETELSDLGRSYEELKTTNDSINNKLEVEQTKISNLLKDMKKQKETSYALISKYRREISTLKTIMRSYVIQIDSLNTQNQRLIAENTEIKKQADWNRERNEKLESDAKKLKKVIAIASVLKTENFVVFPINKRGRETSIRRCYQLKASFTISDNVTAKRGTRTVFLRITRPDNQVIAFDAKAVFKYQNVNLYYTAKRVFEYDGQRLEVSIYWPNDGSLIKGKYKAELFSDGENIGSTEFTLKR